MFGHVVLFPHSLHEVMVAGEQKKHTATLNNMTDFSWFRYFWKHFG